MEVRRIAERKEAILTEMLGDMQPLLVSDIPAFMDGLATNKACAPWSKCFQHTARSGLLLVISNFPCFFKLRLALLCDSSPLHLFPPSLLHLDTLRFETHFHPCFIDPAGSSCFSNFDT